MPLNLITDPWIPVIDTAGARRVIAPWQMGDTGILRPDWPRADLNIACLELLIGLVFLADPPEDFDDWEDRQVPDPERLRERLAAFAPAFNLIGDGPLFLQDFEDLGSEAKSPDMLFIDGASNNALELNKDIFVQRNRYVGLELPLCAIALFTLNSYAPAGGPGFRTSIRGGGPLTTLIDPQRGMWALIWANVPYGLPGQVEDLPWMRPTITSKKDVPPIHPPVGKRISSEVFFGMPRRIRLVVEGDIVTGVIQKNYGNNYETWLHPLSPYRRREAGSEAICLKTRPGAFGYRNYLGVLSKVYQSDLKMRALCLENWEDRGHSAPASVIVAGWAMAKGQATPLDFVLSVHPFLKLSEEEALILSGMVEAADKVADALIGSLVMLLGKGNAKEAEKEAFYRETEPAFLALVQNMIDGAVAELGHQWMKVLRSQALVQFDRLAMPSMDQRSVRDIQSIVAARDHLRLTLSGYRDSSRVIFNALGLPLPSISKKRGKAA